MKDDVREPSPSPKGDTGPLPCATPPPSLPSVPVTFPRLAQAFDGPDECENAKRLRHDVRGELNAVGLQAAYFLQVHDLGRAVLPPDLRAFLRALCGRGPDRPGLVDRLARFVDQVRRLPAQPPPDRPPDAPARAIERRLGAETPSHLVPPRPHRPGLWVCSSAVPARRVSRPSSHLPHPALTCRREAPPGQAHVADRP
jgi:hypothetical protein